MYCIRSSASAYTLPKSNIQLYHDSFKQNINHRLGFCNMLDCLLLHTKFSSKLHTKVYCICGAAGRIPQTSTVGNNYVLAQIRNYVIT